MKALTLLQDYYHDIIYFTDKNNIDEAIAELEALQQPKSCDDCKNRIFYTYDSFKQVTIDKCNIREQLHFNGSCDGLCCDKYESKEQ